MGVYCAVRRTSYIDKKDPAKEQGQSMIQKKIPTNIKLKERNDVEKPLLDQFIGTVRVTPLLTETQEDGA